VDESKLYIQDSASAAPRRGTMLSHPDH